MPVIVKIAKFCFLKE